MGFTSGCNALPCPNRPQSNPVNTAGVPWQIASWLHGASVINAGDGWHEHPTQALLDCFTICRSRPGSATNGLDGRRIAMERQCRVHRRLEPRSLAREVSPAAVGILRPPQCLQTNR